MRNKPAAAASEKYAFAGRRPTQEDAAQDKGEPSGNDPRDGAVRRAALRTARALELPPDVIAGSMRIELSGNREAVVDGCRGVLEYSRESIRLSCGEMKVCFTGRGLELRNLRRDCAIVDGYILSVAFN